MMRNWKEPCSNCHRIQSISTEQWAFYVRCQECIVDRNVDRKSYSPIDSISLVEVTHRSWDWLIVRCGYLNLETHQNLVRFLIREPERESLLTFLGHLAPWFQDFAFVPFMQALITEVPKSEWASILVRLTPATAQKIAYYLKHPEAIAPRT